MYGKVTSRNHRAYSWGHLYNNKSVLTYVESATSLWLCQFSNYFTKYCSIFFLKLRNLDREVTVTGREFQVFGPYKPTPQFTTYKYLIAGHEINFFGKEPSGS